MSPTRIVSKLLDRNFAIDDRNRMPWLERFNLTSFKTKVQQSNTFTGRRKHRSLNGVAHRFDTQGIAGNQHFALGIQHGQGIGSVKPFRNVADHLDQTIRILLL